jgi:CheY-like chemotaxis protein
LPNPTVLIADDDAPTREILRHLLEPYGYDVISAEDSMLAYGLLSTASPAVIIVDLMMPDVDGVGLIRWIRSHQQHAETPIIAMTAFGKEHLNEAKAVGATATIQKPEGIPQLPEIVKRLLEA